MICFYHSADLDGHCSGAIVKKRFPYCEMIGIDYSEEFPFEKCRGERIIICDYCPQPFSENMPKLVDICTELIWIDHHKSEIDEFEKWKSSKIFPTYRTPIDGIQKVGLSASELCWEFYFSKLPMPATVKLLGRYDVWDLEYHSDIMPFQWGMRSYENTLPESEIWNNLLDTDSVHVSRQRRIALATTIERGNILLEHIKGENAGHCRAFAFETEIDGLKAIAINKLGANSQTFDSIWDELKYSCMITFAWKKGQWTVSLYTTKDIDLSLIAKKHGGGGHKQACGFQCKELPFKLT